MTEPLRGSGRGGGGGPKPQERVGGTGGFDRRSRVGDSSEILGGRRIAPIVIKPGEERAILFESPLDRWSLNLRGDPGFFFSDDLVPRSRTPGFALVITANRVLEMASAE